MASKDSFGARGTFEVGGTTHEIFRIAAVDGARGAALHAQGAAGEPAAHRGRRQRHRRPDPRAGCVGSRRRAQRGDPVHPGARDHAGLHRRPVRRRPGHHARGREGPRGRPGEDQPAGTRRARHRPLGHRRLLRHARRREPQRRRSSTSATGSATSSCAGARRAFDEFKVVPPGTGIVHQVNIESLARVVMVRDGQAYPDTCVGTDSHTTMVNGLGVLGWGVGGIEAEAAMLGQPVSMLIPRVVGFKLTGELPAGATATDLVLTITEMLRKHGVVGKFVEFYGDGVAGGAAGQPRHDRQHEPGVRLDGRDLPDRRRDAALPAPDRALRGADRARRGVRQGAGPLARPDHEAALLRASSSSTSARSCRRSPARSARRTASR